VEGVFKMCKSAAVTRDAAHRAVRMVRKGRCDAVGFWFIKNSSVINGANDNPEKLKYRNTEIPSSASLTVGAQFFSRASFTPYIE
ncbi:MAG: hypothetical protein ACRED1_14225, partial [Limisphaerales bacterium]